MSEPLIELVGVGKCFSGVWVIRDIHMTIFAGESIVLVGPSGNGKSSLLKIMAGILQPDQGQVRILGEDLLKMSKKQRVRMVRQMGMLFQKNALFDSLSCSDNLRFPLAETTDLTDAEIERRTTDYLDAVGLLQARDQFPDEISGGMQKRLGIARALALDPKIIFYDDPSAGLDPITSRMIISLILRLKEKHNSTIITVTNDMNRAYQLAGRIFMVVDQTVIEAGDPVSTKQHSDPRIQQFIHGRLKGPLTEAL